MEVLTTTQAAERLRCSPKVIRRYVAEERLVPVVTPRGDRAPLYFAPTDLDRLAEELAAEAEERAASLRGTPA